jgi:hypothetical protein
MIKLLKYDWKRSSDGILSTLAIMVVLEAALSITGLTQNWNESVVLSFSIFGYVLAMSLLFIHCCRTFDQNLKSYSRRLLPLHPINGVGSAVLLSWICAILIAVIAAIHIPIYFAFSDIDTSFIKENFLFEKGSIFWIIIGSAWTYTSLLISILASITVARSFRFKRSAWIGILFFFGTQFIIAWISDIIFDHGEDSLGFIEINSTQTGNAMSVQSSFSIGAFTGPFLLELVFTAGFLYLMLYLINKKVEI